MTPELLAERPLTDTLLVEVWDDEARLIEIRTRPGPWRKGEEYRSTIANRLLQDRVHTVTVTEQRCCAECGVSFFVDINGEQVLAWPSDARRAGST